MSAGFVLAGGRSSRMGTDKARLLWNGKSLLAHAVDVVHTVTETVTIVGIPSLHSVGSVPVISDRIRGAGPLGGIEAALASSVTLWNLIVAVDMPLLQSELLAAILKQAARVPECDAVIPVCDGTLQPLCAAYHRRALPAVQAALNTGTFKIMEALRGCTVDQLEINDVTLFRNVNTPEDWNALIPQKPA